jgi:hypothetical protein
MALAVFVGDSEAHWMANIFGAEVGTAGSLAAGLRSATVLGDSKQSHRRHTLGHRVDEHEPFHAKVSNLTTKPVETGEQHGSTVQS